MRIRSLTAYLSTSFQGIQPSIFHHLTLAALIQSEYVSKGSPRPGRIERGLAQVVPGDGKSLGNSHIGAQGLKKQRWQTLFGRGPVLNDDPPVESSPTVVPVRLPARMDSPFHW